MSDCSAIIVSGGPLCQKHMQKWSDWNLMLYFWAELFEDQLLFVESDGLGGRSWECWCFYTDALKWFWWHIIHYYYYWSHLFSYVYFICIMFFFSFSANTTVKVLWSYSEYRIMKATTVQQTFVVLNFKDDIQYFITGLVKLWFCITGLMNNIISNNLHCLTTNKALFECFSSADVNNKRWKTHSPPL